MKSTSRQTFGAVAVVWGVALTTTIVHAADPLASWSDGKTKRSILDFVAKITKEGSPDFVPVAER